MYIYIISENGEINGWDSPTLLELEKNGVFKFSVHVGGGVFRSKSLFYFIFCKKKFLNLKNKYWELYQNIALSNSK